MVTLVSGTFTGRIKACSVCSTRPAHVRAPNLCQAGSRRDHISTMRHEVKRSQEVVLGVRPQPGASGGVAAEVIVLAEGGVRKFLRQQRLIPRHRVAELDAHERLEARPGACAAPEARSMHV